MTDPHLDHLEDLMANWPALDNTWTEEVRPLNINDNPIFDEDYHPPIPVEVDVPKPSVGRLGSSWDEMHDDFLHKLRDAAGAAERQLRYAIGGARTFHYHDDVRDHLEVALDQVMEALGLMDIHDPQ